MFSKTTLKNGLTLITISLPHLDSVTTLLAVGAGSRYETKNINGISHFLEHMFFKGSRKYPTTEIISNLIDSIGAVNNAATSKEYTYYWIKSAAKHINLASDVISSMIKEPLLLEEEIEREKGVIVEEKRMIKDDSSIFVHYLYENLQFGDHPLGWDITGSEETVNSLVRDNFVSYVDSLYSPKNMILVYAGKISKDIEKIAANFFDSLPQRSQYKFKPYNKREQEKARVIVTYRETDQVNLVLGTRGYDRYDSKRFAARVLSAIFGEGMSSRLFIQVREKRGLAYSVGSEVYSYCDSGVFAIYTGLKKEKIEEGLEVILAEVMRVTMEKVSEEELQKGKEMIRGRLSLRIESTNFLAEYFGINFVLDRKIETIDDYLKKIDEVTIEQVQDAAKELFGKNRLNLQVLGPFKGNSIFEKALKA